MVKRITNLIIVIFILAIATIFNCNAKELEPAFVERTPENSAIIDYLKEYNRERFNSHAWEVLMEKKNKLDEERKDLKITSWEDLEKTKNLQLGKLWWCTKPIEILLKKFRIEK